MKGFSNVSRAATCASGVIPECFSRESVVAKRRDSVQKPYGMTFAWGDRTANIFRTATAGFTLIELLVVVLIIGILAAVALPQYNKAVAKARYTQLITAGKSLKDAMKMYYMANGGYPYYWSQLDITYSCSADLTARYMLWCDKFAVDMFSGDDKNLVLYDTYGLDPNKKEPGPEDLRALSQASYYIVWLDQSPNPGKTECQSKVTGLCQTMGF